MSLGKLIIRASTKISLNDRFTELRRKYGDAYEGAGIGKARLEERRQQSQENRRNQRVAVQMEHRPSVIAALKKTENYPFKNPLPHQKVDNRYNIPVKRRLSVQSRLTLPNGSPLLRGARGAKQDQFAGNNRGRGNNQQHFQNNGNHFWNNPNSSNSHFGSSSSSSNRGSRGGGNRGRRGGWQPRGRGSTRTNHSNNKTFETDSMDVD